MHTEELLYLDLTVEQTENLHCFTETLIIHVSLSISPFWGNMCTLVMPFVLVSVCKYTNDN